MSHRFDWYCHHHSLVSRSDHCRALSLCCSAKECGDGMKTILMKFLALLICGAALTGCGENYSWNQKLTVEVDTPSGIVSSSSVTSVRIVLKVGLMDLWDGKGSAVTGEAVSIDLGNGKFLFALLKNSRRLEGATHWAFYETSIEERKTWPLIGPMIEKSDLRYELKGANQPMLVTFEDISDPASVKEVDPTDLAATFGAGYELKSVALEISDEPITEGRVNKVLVWLETLEGGYLHGGSTSKGSPLGLYGGVFKSGKIND